MSSRVALLREITEQAAAHDRALVAALRDEIARLERIVLDQQAAMKALETKHDRMQVEYAERGQVNARLNRDNARLTRQLAVARPEGAPS